jgi:hypothetical protein
MTSSNFDTSLITSNYGGSGTNNDISYNFPPCEICTHTFTNTSSGDTYYNNNIYLNRNLANSTNYTVIPSCPNSDWDADLTDQVNYGGRIDPNVVISNITSTGFQYSLTVNGNDAGTFYIYFLVIYNLNNLNYPKTYSNQS